ncbi:hypothetical protein PUN28_015065 [Cardiocondyla obscurior]|uniref:Uncharacterized protein n=1 Tax=Cardiocondyla obscurior TaxID=286306 RepID=A0AAW2EZ48_9HYME
MTTNTRVRTNLHARVHTHTHTHKQTDTHKNRYTSRPTHPGLAVNESNGYSDRHREHDYEKIPVARYLTTFHNEPMLMGRKFLQTKVISLARAFHNLPLYNYFAFDSANSTAFVKIYCDINVRED